MSAKKPQLHNASKTYSPRFDGHWEYWLPKIHDFKEGGKSYPQIEKLIREDPKAIKEQFKTNAEQIRRRYLAYHKTIQDENIQDRPQQSSKPSQSTRSTVNREQRAPPEHQRYDLQPGSGSPHFAAITDQARQKVHTGSHTDDTTATRTPKTVIQPALEILGSEDDGAAVLRPLVIGNEDHDNDLPEASSMQIEYTDMTGLLNFALTDFEAGNNTYLGSVNEVDLAQGTWTWNPAFNESHSIASAHPLAEVTGSHTDVFLPPVELPGPLQPQLSEVGRQFVHLVPHDMQSCLDFVKNVEKQQVLQDPLEAFYLAAVAAMGDRRPALALSALECLVIVRAHHELKDGLDSYIQDVAITEALNKTVPVGRARERARSFVQACKSYRSCIEDGVHEYTSISINIPLQPQTQASYA